MRDIEQEIADIKDRLARIPNHQLDGRIELRRKLADLYRESLQTTDKQNLTKPDR